MMKVKDRKKAHKIRQENGSKGGIKSWKVTKSKYTKEEIREMRSRAGKRGMAKRWGYKLIEKYD